MAVNYKVGDSIRILDASSISCGFDLTNGNTYEINKVSDTGSLYILDDVSDEMSITTSELSYIEKVSKSSAPQFEGYVNIRQVSNLDNGNLLITLECDETINMALIKAERDVFAKKQERKAEIQTEIARLQRELEELQ